MLFLEFFRAYFECHLLKKKIPHLDRRTNDRLLAEPGLALRPFEGDALPARSAARLLGRSAAAAGRPHRS